MTAADQTSSLGATALGAGAWESVRQETNHVIGPASNGPNDETASYLADAMANARATGVIRFSGLGLHSLPDEISELADIERMYLVQNELDHLPANIVKHLTNLTELDARGNSLSSLPSEIRHLERIEELYLDDNEIASLPSEIGELRHLRTLDLEHNHLDCLPPEIGNLRSLEQLDLRGNKLASLPSEIGKLVNLRRLYLRDNQLQDLPPEIGRLTKLEKLELDGNHLTSLPREMAPLFGRAITLSLRGNPLEDPLTELFDRGLPSLASYLKSLEDAIPHYEAKVLVVGEGNVGKTSLLAALQGKPFVVGRETTHGIDIQLLGLAHPDIGTDMTVRVWDFGGQEVYRITHQFFFSRRALYVLVWSAREGQEQNEVESWLRRIRIRIGRDARVLLVATHCEERRPELDYPQLERGFPDMLAGMYEIDNRTSKGVDALRSAIANEAAALPQMGKLLSPRWIAARDDLLMHYREAPQMPFTEFAAICARHGLESEEVTTLAELLHDLGQIIYYGDDDGLRSIVVLSPEWLTKAIGYVLEDPQAKRSLGVISHSGLRRIWLESDRDKMYPAHHHPYFLRMMEKFDICYRLDDKQSSLVAQLVPHARPPLPWDADTPLSPALRSVTLICRLSDHAAGLVSWLTVRHHHASLGKHWRSGVFLRHPTSAYASEALIELRGATCLVVQVRAPSPDLYLSVIRDSIEYLLEARWPGLTYDLLIPCPTRQCEGEFPLTGLMRLRERGRTIHDCLLCDSTHNVSELLTGFSQTDGDLSRQLASLREETMGLSENVQNVQESVGRVELLVTRSVNSQRRLLKIATTEVRDCPRVFTIAPGAASLARRIRISLEYVQLTLWCEQNGEWHPWEPATYEIKQARDWMRRIAPYAKLIFGSLQLVVPIAAAVAGVLLPKPDIEDMAQRLRLMETLVGKLPREVAPQSSELDPRNRQLTIAEGGGLRAVRALLFELDGSRFFGDLRRVVSAAGDTLWVCPRHYPEYDPGLPLIPE